MPKSAHIVPETNADVDAQAAAEAQAVADAQAAAGARWRDLFFPGGAPLPAGEEPGLHDAPGDGGLRRATVHPIQDSEMWALKEKIESLHWIASEVDFGADARDAARLAPDEYRLLARVLGWFGPADVAVMEGLDEAARRYVTKTEAVHYFAGQSHQEAVHSEAYSLQIERVLRAEDRAAARAAVHGDPAVAAAARWVRWLVGAGVGAGPFFAAMAFLEGGLFSGFFAIIQSFKERGLLPGVTQMNEFICRDENLHTQFWCFLLRERLAVRPPADFVAAVARETYALAELFIDRALPGGAPPVNGLDGPELKLYVQGMFDVVASQAGYPPVFGGQESRIAVMMRKLELNQLSKANFFERKVTAYQKVTDPGSFAFGLKSEFAECPE